MKKMRKILLFLLIVIVVFARCGSEDGNSENERNTAVSSQTESTQTDSRENTRAESTQEESRKSDVKTTGETASETDTEASPNEVSEEFDVSQIPAYSGETYKVVNGNTPYFSEEELTENSFEEYSSLDALGRCGVCTACVGQDVMPEEERGEIGSVKPTGWQTIKYDCVDGKYLYNRCHLLGYQLTGENANEKNLITGTRFLNVDGMLPFEDMVADYVKETNNHVLYRVTPVFEGNNLVASGVLMEAESVEDRGESILFNVYCYNVQPGVTIDYKDGTSKLDSASSYTEKQAKKSTEKKAEASTEKKTKKSTEKKAETSTKKSTEEETVTVWIPNTGSKYHSRPGCSNMKNPKEVTLEEAKSMGYEPCKRCY